MQQVDRLASTFVTLDEGLEREFEERLRQSSTLAFRVAFAVLRQREDAEDVAQDAFAKAYRSFRTLRDPARFRAWLVRMTWRLALDRQRANRRRIVRESTHAEIASTAPGGSEERPARIWAAIDALPVKLRMTLILASIEGHDVRDVAGALGVPEGTVKSRLFAARRRLKELLDA